MRATDDCHEHCQQLAPTFRSVTARVELRDFSLVRAFGAWRVFTTLHTLRRLDPLLLVGVIFRE